MKPQNKEVEVTLKSGKKITVMKKEVEGLRKAGKLASGKQGK